MSAYSTPEAGFRRGTIEANGRVEFRLRRDADDPGEVHGTAAIGTLAEVRQLLEERLKDWKPPTGTFDLVVGKVRISHGSTEWILDAKGGDCAEVARSLVLQLAAWDVSATVSR